MLQSISYLRFSARMALGLPLAFIVALALALLPDRQHSTGAFDPPSSGLYLALDCNVLASGIQDVCELPLGATTLDIDLILGNVEHPLTAIAAFNLEVVANQSVFNPSVGVDSNRNSNPDFAVVGEPADWTCTPPSPERDLDPDPAVADSFLSCFDASLGGIPSLATGSTARIATVHYEIAGSGSGTFDPQDVSVFDLVLSRQLDARGGEHGEKSSA